MNGFIISCLYTDNSRSYVSNTSPILWSNTIEQAKIFDTFSDTKFEIECNFKEFTSFLNCTKIHSIWILEYSNNELLRKERFL